MKKTQFPKAEYSVAMSLETGCIVMVRNLNKQVKVMGSLTRDDSLKFARGIIDWVPDALDAKPAEPERPKLTVVN